MKYNDITLVGRLTRDPEIVTTPAGMQIAKISLAVGRDFKNKETGEYETDFFNCSAFSKTAEFVGNYARKGKLVLVSGQMHSRKWTSQAGENHTQWEVVVNKFQLMDKIETEQQPQNTQVTPPVSSRQNTAQAQQPSYEMPTAYDPFADDDIGDGKF